MTGNESKKPLFIITLEKGEKNKVNKIMIGLAVLVMVVLAACTARGASVPPGERVFYMNAIEIKGGTSADKLAPPTQSPEAIGKAFSYVAPGKVAGNPTRWEVGAYQFNPSALTVFQGDRVKLVLFVVNGDLHKDRIEGPDGRIVVPETEHNRGRLYEITFMADKAGIYQLRCDEHKEHMRAIITVVPKA